MSSRLGRLTQRDRPGPTGSYTPDRATSFSAGAKLRMSLGTDSLRGVPQETVAPFQSVVEAAAGGSAEAFEELFQRYSGRVRVFADVRGSADPEAVSNDVMLKVFRNLHSFSGDERAFTRWVFAITRNTVIDAHRMRSRRPNLVTAIVPEAPSRSAEEVVVEQLAGSEITHLLECLTLDQREVVSLRILEDLSVADVAQIVGRSETAVKGLQRRGLAAMRKAMGKGDAR